MCAGVVSWGLYTDLVLYIYSLDFDDRPLALVELRNQLTYRFAALKSLRTRAQCMAL